MSAATTVLVIVGAGGVAASLGVFAFRAWKAQTQPAPDLGLHRFGGEPGLGKRPLPVKEDGLPPPGIVLAKRIAHAAPGEDERTQFVPLQRAEDTVDEDAITRPHPPE